MNDFNYNGYGGGFYSSMPRWDEFTLEDEVRARKRFSRMFLALAVYLIVSSVIIFGVQIALILTLGEEKASEFFNSTMLIIINSVAMYGIAFPILFLMTRKMRSTARIPRTMSLKEFFMLFLVAEAFMYAGSLVGTYLNTFIGTLTGAPIEDTTAALIETTPMWLIIVVVVIIGPIFEELIFRKIFMDKLGIYGDRIAIIASAVAFGLFHGNLYQFFYAALIGLILGYIYSKTGNVLYTIALHMILNFLGSVIPMLLMDKMDRYLVLSEQIVAGAEIDMAEYTRLSLIVGTYSFVQLALVIAGVIVFFQNRRKIFVSDRCEVLIPKHRRAYVILANVGAILFIIIVSLSIISEIVMPIIDAMQSIPPEAIPPESIPPIDNPAGGDSHF